MKTKTLILFAVGVGLSALSQSLATSGDVAPFADSGVSIERAVYHISGLAALLAAVGCLLGAGYSLFRGTD